MGAVADFSGKEIFEWSIAKMKASRIPIPAMPDGKDEQYEFPENPDDLTHTELGQLMLRIAAYGGKRNVQLGILESELVALDREYKLKIGVFGIEIREEMGGRPSHETVEFGVLERHEELMPLYKRMTELEVVRANLRRQCETYQEHWKALSRELSRRYDESKTGG